MADSPASAASAGREHKRGKVRSPEQLNQDAADRALMQQVSTGDEAAFGSFYRRFSPGVFSMIYEIVRDQKDSEDVLQESFLQMWNKASTYDPQRSSVFTWSVMIARNRAIDRVRARQRRARTADAAAAEAAVTPEEHVPRADEMMSLNEQSDRVRAALSRLSESQQKVIDLAFFGGLTQAEISTELGAPLGTVKARIRRGLLALRDVLGAKP